MVERYNRTLAMMLAMFVSENKDDWDDHPMQRSFDFAHGNLQSRFCRQKRYYDTKFKSRDYQVDGLVFRWYPLEANQKLGLGWIGPYKVIRKISDITYEIERCADNKRKIVHVDHLKPVVLPTELNETDAQEMDITELNESTVDIELSNHNIDDADDHSYQKEMETVKMNSPKFSRTGRLIKPPVLFSP